jgi:DNA-binding transcriptional ArsR family regulator
MPLDLDAPQLSNSEPTRTVRTDGVSGKAKEASALLKALAHASRLMIMCFLCDGEKSVTELERMLELRQPTVSQQLARLRTDGLVATRRDGKTVYYSIANPDVRVIIGAVQGVFSRDKTSA